MTAFSPASQSRHVRDETITPMSSPSAAAETSTAAEVADAFREARERTLALVSSVTDDDLERVHSKLMSPLLIGASPRIARPSALTPPGAVAVHPIG